jgi:hypothetical protein
LGLLVSDSHNLGDADGPEPSYVWLEAAKRARTLARLQILREGVSVNRQREGKRGTKTTIYRHGVPKETCQGAFRTHDLPQRLGKPHDGLEFRLRELLEF